VTLSCVDQFPPIGVIGDSGTLFIAAHQIAAHQTTAQQTNTVAAPVQQRH